MNPHSKEPHADGCRPLQSGLLRHVLKLGMAFVLGISGLPCACAAVAPMGVAPYKVEAVFLRNFTRYVVWPESAFKGADSVWQICILGDDPFGNVLELALEGRVEQGRRFHVSRVDSVEHIPPCQIVFVSISDPIRRRAAMDYLRSRPILTVGESPEFLMEGGIIQLQIADCIEMSINLDQARSISLQIPTKMLEISREVLENGVLRRTR